MDVLRTFVTGFELGSFASAAERLGRSQSTVSTQLRRLEEQAGKPLVRRAGRGLGLTTAGEGMLGYARRILELNDEAIESIRGIDVEGWARLGLPQDFAELWLPAVLRQFSNAHPKVRVEIQVDRSVPLVEKVVAGELDAALVWGDGSDGPHGERVADFPMRWIGPIGWTGLTGLGREPLPFAAFSPPCTFRSAAIEALDAAGLPWRLAFTSPSLSGLWAAAEGGLGLTARTTVNLPRTLVALDPVVTGLPKLPAASLALYRAEAEPNAAVGRLTALLLENLGKDGQPAVGFA